MWCCRIADVRVYVVREMNIEIGYFLQMTPVFFALPRGRMLSPTSPKVRTSNNVDLHSTNC